MERTNGRHKLRLLVSNEGVLPTYQVNCETILRAGMALSQKRRFFASLRRERVFTIPFHLTVPMPIFMGRGGEKKGLAGKSEIHVDYPLSPGFSLV